MLLFLFVVEVGGNVANAQKKELDESAYQQWRKVDTYQLSADGKWVLYDYTFFDNVEANILNDSVYFLYDVATERTDTLIGIAEPRFWAGGEWLAYWSGKKFVVTRLKDKKCVKWEQEPVLDDKLPLAIHHDDKMCVVENVVDGQKRKLKGLLYYALYGIEGDGVFLYQRDGFRELCFVFDFSAAMIDIPTYVSKGYVIFAPDVKIEIGKPVESACNTVISGTEALIAEGIAKSDRIGLQGHSWSGYLVASIVARTNIFRCVNVGAATVNLPAVYTSLRGDGSSNMLMYEDWQCRMGKTLWEDVAGYIENSPLFVADKIQTPMLIFHNDHDQAVDYREGLALFLAMRRLGKPVWLLNYPGEGHFLYSREAQRDWTKRMEQFFNYYLKDSVKPSWM